MKASVIAVAVVLAAFVCGSWAAPVLLAAHRKCDSGILCFKEQVDLVTVNPATGTLGNVIGTVVPEERAYLIDDEYISVSAYSAAQGLYFYAVVEQKTTTLYTINSKTGATLHTSQIADLDAKNLTSLTYEDSTNTLWATAIRNELYQVDPATGKTTAAAQLFPFGTFRVTGPAALDAKNRILYLEAERGDGGCWQLFGVWLANPSHVNASQCMPNDGILTRQIVFMAIAADGAILNVANEQLGPTVNDFDMSPTALNAFIQIIGFEPFVGTTFDSSDHNIAYDATNNVIYMIVNDDNDNTSFLAVNVSAKSVADPVEMKFKNFLSNVYVM
jgi:hypothetical protein